MNRLSAEEEEDDIDVVRTSIRRARNTLRGFGPADNDNNYDSDHTDRERVRAVHSNHGTSQQRTAGGVFDAGQSGSVAILPATTAGNLDLADVLFAAHPEAFNRNLTRPAEDLLHFDAPAPRTAAVSDSSSHHGVVGYSDSPVRPLPVLRVEQQAPPAAAPQAEQRGPPVLSVRDLQLNDRSPPTPMSYTPDTSTSGESFAMSTDGRELNSSAMQTRPVHRQQQQPVNSWASQVMGFLSPTGSDNVDLSDM